MMALLVWAVVASGVAVVAILLVVSAVVLVRNERKSLLRALDREESAHLAEIARLHAQYTTMLERLANIVNYGTATPKEGVVQEAEPDAETVVRQRVREETIETGVIRMKAAYEAMGITLPEAEIREEVISMLGGLSPTPSPAVALVKS
jgi:hypothetical protein